jgi:endonuclease YncB( thermonuclease family)
VAAPDFYDWGMEGVIHVVDGDTVDVVLSRVVGHLAGFDIVARSSDKTRLRLVHLDTPERGEPGHEQATEELQGWLVDKFLGTGLRVQTEVKPDAFGRLLADIYSATDRAATASDFMVRDANHGAGWPVWIKGQ